MYNISLFFILCFRKYYNVLTTSISWILVWQAGFGHAFVHGIPLMTVDVKQHHNCNFWTSYHVSETVLFVKEFHHLETQWLVIGNMLNVHGTTFAYFTILLDNKNNIVLSNLLGILPNSSVYCNVTDCHIFVQYIQ